MYTANLENCKKLYELSGWDNNAGTGHKDRLHMWVQSYSTWEMGAGNEDYGKPGVKQRGVDIGEWRVTDDPRHRMGVPEVVFNWWWDEVHAIERAAIPAYDAGYLLRKLPGDNIAFANSRENRWYVCLILMGIRGPGMQSSFSGEGDTPEDALCLLCFELIEKGIIKL